MQVGELQLAVKRIVELLIKTDIRSAVDQYRAAKPEQRVVAVTKLEHAGARIIEHFDSMSDAEREVVRVLHLDMLGATDYWQSLTRNGLEQRQQQAEIVRLASRVMFASSQLPHMVALLGTAPAESDSVAYKMADDESRLVIRLVDAGEKAADPDRIARSIDGIDMLYSACASVARKPAMNLRLDGIQGNATREIHFTGENDSISAVVAVIRSIPQALAAQDSSKELDLDELVASLPIFDDLNTLASLGTFSESDLKDISETMHQGALLALGSGVVLVPPVPAVHDASTARPVQTAQPIEAAQDKTPGKVDADDEYYERYLRQREAMQQLEGGGIVDEEAENQQRKDAIEDLLKSLGSSKKES
ncbi:MAG: hypothetical protein V3U76_00595 [Granulosicoccus sp.]